VGRLIVLMGPTGAGKSAQGDLLAAALGGVHLSSGTLLRRDPVTAKLLEDGRLGDSAEVHRVVGEAMTEVPEDKPLVLDGTPRTMSDVQWMAKELYKFHRTLEKVVMIDIDFDTSLVRLVGKRGRTDDNVDAIKAKWRLFDEITKPVAEQYQKEGLLVEVDGRGSIENVHREVVKAVSRVSAR
jgi:adenylate kinase